MAGSFGFAPRSPPFPVAALTGDNVVHRSSHMPWYGGPTLLDYLETRRSRGRAATTRRSACRCSSCCAPRAISAAMPGPSRSGRIRSASGSSMRGAGSAPRCRRIATMDGDLAYAGKGDAVTLVLDSDLDISRGAVLSEVARRPDQCRCDRGAAGLAVRDALRSGERLSAAHRDRSHAGHEHEHLGARRFRDARRRRRRMLAPSTTSPIAASCSAARPRSTCSASCR